VLVLVLGCALGSRNPRHPRPQKQTNRAFRTLCSQPASASASVHGSGRGVSRHVTQKYNHKAQSACLAQSAKQKIKQSHEGVGEASAAAARRVKKNAYSMSTNSHTVRGTRISRTDARMSRADAPGPLVGSPVLTYSKHITCTQSKHELVYTPMPTPTTDTQADNERRNGTASCARIHTYMRRILSHIISHIAYRISYIHCGGAGDFWVPDQTSGRCQAMHTFDFRSILPPWT
jgi:hypothetical protein